MFQIKICGVKSVKDAQLAMLAGADAVGLNFFEKSVRCIDLAMAEKIAQVLPPKVSKVGIFVNAPVDEMRLITARAKLDVLQLHGDEPPELLGELGDAKVIRAFRFGDQGVDSILDYLNACPEGRQPTAILVDACVFGEFGGTGQKCNWPELASHRERLRQVPMILAGGLTPFNVTEAINIVKPDAVDTASGVESGEGQKDPMLIRAFVTSAKKAFAALP